MCLVSVAFHAHPRYPLIVAANRDELHARPTAGAGWWPDLPGVFGGRDLVANGSWLAVASAGRLALVTNAPARAGPGRDQAASRGQLVRDFVAGVASAADYAAQVHARAADFAGFTLVLAEAGSVSWLAAGAAPYRCAELERGGVLALSNGPLDPPWPKTRYLAAAVRRLVAEEHADLETSLLAVLEARHIGPVGAPAEGAPAPGELAHRPFVVGAEYGTRASTVVLWDRTGRCHFTERLFDAAGRRVAECRETFGLRAAAA